MACMVAKALNCRIPEKTWFERKQYFYPDMTKNYQISQFASPLGQEGYVDIEGEWGVKRVRIHECHLEEDAGKMIHTGTVSLLDYNRAGVSLLEIVTEPDMETGEEAEVFIQQLRRMVRYLNVCDGNMEEGSLRADANVSINLRGQGLGRKVEIKNLNSSRFVRLGLNYEIERQSKILDAGKTVVQETRLWNENRDQTEPMRRKENAQDYRYFPEPDLPIFTPDAAFLKSVDESMVELPLPRQKRLAAEYGLSAKQAALICEEKAFADYFEETVAECDYRKHPQAAKNVTNWLLTDIKHILSREAVLLADIDAFKITPKRLAVLIMMVMDGKVSVKNAKQALELMRLEDKDPEDIIAEKGWSQITDPAEIATAVAEVEKEEAETIKELSTLMTDNGNPKRVRSLSAYLTGKILARTGGRADPKLVGEQIEQMIRKQAVHP
jgi:aspartyl-tRNA(Asn)/glutamyl-tRNA(Gln) amidotransferase subunit B